MVERLNRRDQFAHLRAHATTVREGQLRISFADPDEAIGPNGPAAAFAIPKRYGSAVRRNLVRRRLRALMREFSDRGELPRRWFLVSVKGSTGDPGYGDLSRWFSTALERIPATAPKASGPQESSGSLSNGPGR